MEGLYNGLFLHVVLYNGHCHKIVEEGGRMIYFPDAGQMKAADRYTIDVLGIPSLELMERGPESAGRQCCAAREITAETDSPLHGC